MAAAGDDAMVVPLLSALEFQFGVCFFIIFCIIALLFFFFLCAFDFDRDSVIACVTATARLCNIDAAQKGKNAAHKRDLESGISKCTVDGVVSVAGRSCNHHGHKNIFAACCMHCS